MFVKRDETGKIVSLFVGCVPDDPSGYEEVPDDEQTVRDYIAANRKPVVQENTAEERITALEEELAAAKILLGVE